MSTAALKTPVEEQSAAQLSLVPTAKPAAEQLSVDLHPLTPVIAAFVVAFFIAITLVGSFAAWIYFLRDSGVMAP